MECHIYLDTARLYSVKLLFSVRPPHWNFEGLTFVSGELIDKMSQQLGERPLLGGQGKIGLPGCTQC